MKKNEILEQILNEVDKHPDIVSRRDALKYLTLSPIAASVITSSSLNSSEIKSSNALGKIVIVGGGLSGISTAARLQKSLLNSNITIIEPNPLSASYQPGLSLVAAGIWDISEIIYNRNDKIPYGVKLIKGKATSFDPINNKLTVDDKLEVHYDQLIIATGVELNFGAINGLKGSITSNCNTYTQESPLGKDGLHSIFFQDGATTTFKGIKELIKKAKKHTGHKKLQAVFTHPNTPIKGASSSKEIIYLVHSHLLDAGVRDKVEISFYTNGVNLLNVTEFHHAIVKQFQKRDFKWKYQHNLIQIDSINKTATFNKQRTIQGAYDENLKEYEQIIKHERLEVSYDFLHVTPPMKASDIVGSSPLGSTRGWIPVNKETLQHIKFKNIFSLGDVVATPLGKTSASVGKQHKVLVQNIIASMKDEKTLPAKYNGYTCYPLATDIGKVMLSEFDWSMKAVPTFALNPTQERWVWWLLKVYVLKPMTMEGMMKGRA